jgi:hypothetical protein
MRFKNAAQRKAVMAKIRHIDPHKIMTTYERLLPHEHYNMTVNEMRKVIAKGDKLPPILIDKDHELIDGRHRLQAYKMEGIKKVPVIIGMTPYAMKITRNGKEIKLRRGRIQGQPFAYEVRS